ncbi:T9SS type A sorting domain-containing protein [Flavivirga aquimarina]|uniref:T9SS type A sorting domain-containing protein n=1 Tax=Flavivirga aquimarina TaxID=2027862 RepID=A0ABT8WFK6_9FLAO|nr:T9SS type A sorting domain-containing protein [Flavivirga aquimarina]MDO5971799.1 T9SS type A sorting domain-containing protein [Flavivirga aquimarina]
MKNYYTLKVLAFLCLLVSCIQLQAQTIVNSLSELMPYLDDDNANVKLVPGTYWITEEDAKNGLYETGTDIVGRLSKSLLLFAGNNSTYDFTDVTINVETKVFQAYGSSYQIYETHTVGNNNVIKNLTLVDVGASEDAPTRGANSIVMDGENNRIEGFHCTIRGSFPYGYGDIFGKGGGSVISHRKHSACLVRGNSNHVKNSTFIHRAYGHGIYFQAANDPIIEGCRVEGELRTTDEVLAEEGTGSPADNVDFMTVWGYRLQPGYTFSLQEDGIRAYNAGETIINGVELERGTNRPRVIDCEVVKMRSGVTIGWAQGDKYVENCTALACESGFWCGSDAEVINCRGDASVGPLYSEDVERSNSNIELTLLNNYVPKYGNTPTMYIAGTNHNVTLKDGTENVDNEIEILIGGTRLGHRWLAGSGEEPPYKDANNIVFENQGYFPITLGANCSQANIASCSAVTDNGTNNTINSFTCTPLNSNDIIWISATPSNINMDALGETQQLTTTIYPTNATNQNVIYTSNNTSVATVDANGLITAIGYGATAITVATLDGEHVSVSAVTVTRDIGINLALASNGSIASQSTTDFGGLPELAIDGNTDGNFGGGSVSHTSNDAGLKWWQVDLGEDKILWSIVIYNRTGSNYGERLNNFTVSVIDSNGNTTFSEIYVDPPNPSLTIDVDEITGKIVRIEKTSDRGITLAEVEVYGTSVLSVEETTLNTIKLFPNSVTNQFTITNSQGAVIKIYNMVGKLMMKTKIQGNSESIDVSNFNSGVYYIQINNKGIIASKKMVKN